MTGLDLAGTHSVDDVLDALVAVRSEGAAEGVILGFGWDEDRLARAPSADARRGRPRGAGDAAVYLARVDGHSGWRRRPSSTPRRASGRGRLRADGLVRRAAHHPYPTRSPDSPSPTSGARQPCRRCSTRRRVGSVQCTSYPRRTSTRSLMSRCCARSSPATAAGRGGLLGSTLRTAVLRSPGARTVGSRRRSQRRRFARVAHAWLSAPYADAPENAVALPRPLSRHRARRRVHQGRCPGGLPLIGDAAVRRVKAIVARPSSVASTPCWVHGTGWSTWR